MNQELKIGQNLKYFRELKGVTQYEMADYAGLSKNYISALERDKNNPSIQVIISYCSKLNITPNDILGFKNNIMPELLSLLSSLNPEMQERYYKILKALVE